MGDVIKILGSRLRLEQPANGFRTSTDAVMLAAACPAQEGETVLDLGCGMGSAAFCVLRRVADTTLTGIDILPDVIELAKSNAEMNQMEDRTDFRCIDIRDFELETFDHVICNPPYLEAGAHIESPVPEKQIAIAHSIGMGEDDMDLKDWIDCAFRSIRGKGSLTIINRAENVAEIIRVMGKRFGAVEIIPLWPKTKLDAKRVIIRARKHRLSPTRMHNGVVMHKNDGEYTEAAQKVLRDMQPIA